jgi:hypothetical protein
MHSISTPNPPVMVYTLPADLQDKSRVELNETDETKAAALAALRAKLDIASMPVAASAEASWQPIRSDEDFMLRFLRQKKFRVRSRLRPVTFCNVLSG